MLVGVSYFELVIMFEITVASRHALLALDMDLISCRFVRNGDTLPSGCHPGSWVLCSALSVNYLGDGRFVP